MDLYFTEAGDLAVSSHGDIAVTENGLRETGQQAHIRTMTAIGDYLLYPGLGADLHKLYGMPQSEATGNFGISLIENALEREGILAGRRYKITATPTSEQSIRFDIMIITTLRADVLLSIERNLSSRN